MGTRAYQKLNPITRRFTKLEPNEVFNDDAISLQTIIAEYYFLLFCIVLDQSKLHAKDFRDMTKIPEDRAEQNRHFCGVYFSRMVKDNSIILFLFESYIYELVPNKNLTRPHEDLRSQSRMKFLTTMPNLCKRSLPNTIFCFFAILQTSLSQLQNIFPISRRQCRAKPKTKVVVIWSIWVSISYEIFCKYQK